MPAFLKNLLQHDAATVDGAFVMPATVAVSKKQVLASFLDGAAQEVAPIAFQGKSAASQNGKRFFSAFTEPTKEDAEAEDAKDAEAGEEVAPAEGHHHGEAAKAHDGHHHATEDKGDSANTEAEKKEDAE
eukprot:gb/GFBE01077249.1/.p1 GENE.gb/GFBE01077249.1/~~gb/GFBE01077249.1/.p1  ORF type:complete len:130 (+),score=43.71 gb/GFBE01077249.1/:1-390(+)